MDDDWKTRADNLVRVIGGSDRALTLFLEANVESVKQVLRGLGPDDKDPREGAGARIVFNLSCKHMPNLCGDENRKAAEPYKNAYDLSRVSDDRRKVDEAIAKATGLAPSTIYFAALETSGSGIRFYGDMCLVLKLPAPAKDGTSEWSSMQVLDRNSYDIIREPARTTINGAVRTGRLYVDAAAEVLQTWRGSWDADLEHLVAIKVLPVLPVALRRWTTGQIASNVLDDEDYIEVLYPKRFGIGDVYEVRLSATDAAAEAEIADREANGEAPGIHELEWRQQRREAKKALAAAGVPLRVITTTGRIKGA